MPKHTYWLTYFFELFPALKTNAKNLGDSFILHEHPDKHSSEPVLTAMIYMAFLFLLALIARRRLVNLRESAVPSEKLTLVTFFEVFFGYFYNLMKDVMGPQRAKEHFPLIGASALFIIFSNLIGIVPGFGSPTSSWNVTLGMALVVAVWFHAAGIKKHGIGGYAKHFMGPVWYLAPLILVIEIFSIVVIRPITLSIRLMMNIAVDHLLGSIFIGLVTLFVPIPVIFLGLLVCVVQTLVFCLLATVYIALATEDHEHDHGHGEGVSGHDHDHDAAPAH